MKSWELFWIRRCSLYSNSVCCVCGVCVCGVCVCVCVCVVLCVCVCVWVCVVWVWWGVVGVCVCVCVCVVCVCVLLCVCVCGCVGCVLRVCVGVLGVCCVCVVCVCVCVCVCCVCVWVCVCGVCVQVWPERLRVICLLYRFLSEVLGCGTVYQRNTCANYQHMVRIDNRLPRGGKSERGIERQSVREKDEDDGEKKKGWVCMRTPQRGLCVYFLFLSLSILGHGHLTRLMEFQHQFKRRKVSFISMQCSAQNKWWLCCIFANS